MDDDEEGLRLSSFLKTYPPAITWGPSEGAEGRAGKSKRKPQLLITRCLYTKELQQRWRKVASWGLRAGEGKVSHNITNRSSILYRRWAAPWKSARRIETAGVVFCCSVL